VKAGKELGGGDIEVLNDFYSCEESRLWEEADVASTETTHSNKEVKFGGLSLKIDTKEDMTTMGSKGQTIIVFWPLDIQSYRRDINTHRLNYGVK
jgi:hypothetical protein